MTAVVADTHVVLWSLTAPHRLSASALAALQSAVRSGYPIFVASVSVVEVVYLIEKGRLPRTVLDSLAGELARPDSGIAIVPLDLAIAWTVERVPRAAVPDMSDRIIAATALHLGLPLVTRDERIRASGVQTVW